MNTDLSPGFADPVADAQQCFRAVLDAMAHPGRIRAVRAPAPSPLCPAAGAVLLTLVDVETPIWLDPAASAARSWLAFHTGAETAPLDRARFVLTIGGATSLASICAAAATGTDEEPETSATIIAQVGALGTGTTYTLEGPGLRQPATLLVEGLPAGFAELWARNHALFPRGFDLILVAGDTLAALPRGITVTEG